LGQQDACQKERDRWDAKGRAFHKTPHCDKYFSAIHIRKNVGGDDPFREGPRLQDFSCPDGNRPVRRPEASTGARQH
jgi:hypothetical protein